MRITRIQDVTLSGIIIVDNHYFSFADEGLIEEYEIHVGTKRNQIRIWQILRLSVDKLTELSIIRSVSCPYYK
jgi:hypothetical protein